MMFLARVLLLVCSIFAVTGTLVDKHESCEFWAGEGECESNPNYMLNNCAKVLKDIVDMFVYKFAYYHLILDYNYTGVCSGEENSCGA